MIIELAGETLELLPQRAIYWPSQQMLLVADIHFGKAAAFRAKGIPVPHGTTTQNLLALEQLISLRKINRILFLGDFLHAATSHAANTLASIRGWRSRHPDLSLTLVRGNHDVHAGDPPADLGIELVDEPHCIGPFAFCHHPELASDGYVMAGHVHPVYQLAAAGDSMRLPCFTLNARRAILPSFGAFTGGYAITPKQGDRLFLAAEESVYEVPLK